VLFRSRRRRERHGDMPRYEGMDDLLQQVRDRLGVLEQAPHPSEEPDAQEGYASLLEAVVLVVRDAGQLRSLLASEKLRAVTSQQHEELLSLLGKALRELWSCKAALERTRRD